jgi:DNA (cytosine-5)-methyltransferase 1
VIYGSVCSGIEAATAAWHPLGWKASFFSEIEAFPRSVLAHHYPETPLHGDFTTIKAGEYEPIDLLVGGTPCQSFSVAGLRGGLDDDRGNLALEYLRLADRLRPRWLVWENVPGVLSSNGGRDFGSILGGMGELGYGVAYRVLDAEFFGVAQRRRRVFVVGYLGDWRRAAAVLFERHSLSGNPAPRRQSRESVAGGPRGGSEGHFLGGFDYESNAHGAGDPTGPLSRGSPSGGGHPLPAVAFAIQERAVCENPNAGPDGAGFRSDNAAYTLEARTVPQAVAFQPGNLRRGAGAPPSEAVFPTLKSDHGRGLSDQHPHVFAASSVRRLTPRECERLQGFPDDFTLVPHRGKPAADGPRYKALGNSMAVPCMAWIGQRIAAVDALPINRAVTS